MAYDPPSKPDSKAFGPEGAGCLCQTSSECESNPSANLLLVPLVSETPANESAASSVETSPVATKDSDGVEKFDKLASDRLPFGTPRQNRLSTPEDARGHDAGLEQPPPPTSALPEPCEEEEDDDFWIPRGKQNGAGASVKKPPPPPPHPTN
ncbi:hypothetical protein ONZ51_g2724 [Trametes cubensis]|uniref:Uncharacterized protein n=1 Tax=Trametes cubensis TaxID=1111947 RepID=A0AAD7TZ65_9APHY|nr:hypothetical protein ONZ51_g2724 [Trametes cubensis]